MPRNTKKSAAGNGTIRKKTVTKNGKNYTYWEARFTAGYSSDGKQVQKSVTGQTQKEVRQKMQGAILAVDTGEYVAPSKMTVSEWMDIWTSDYMVAVKPLTAQTYVNCIENHIKPGLGYFQLSALKPHTVQHFYNSLSNNKAEPLAPKTVKNIHGVLRKALQQAVSNGYIKSNPATACVLPKVRRPEIEPLGRNEIAAFLQEVTKDEYENLFTVAIFTGMRQGELLGLTWENVNFEKGIIFVKQQLQCKDGRYFFETPKNGKGRVIAPASVVLNALHNEQERQKNAQNQAGASWNNQYNLVFTDALGKNLVRRTVVKHFKKVAERVGVPNARFHDLRHSFAVTSLQAGDDIKTVQGNLGHATAAFTLDVYGHVLDEMRRDSADRMQRFYESLQNGSVHQ